MNKSIDLENIKEQIRRLKEKMPVYKDILTFYEKIVTKQADIRPSIEIPSSELEGELKNLQTKEGFPLINKEDFILDIPSSIILFEYLCEIGKNTTGKMEADIHAIEQFMRNGTIELEELIKRHFDDDYLDKITVEMDLNKALLKFLIHASIKPSINVNVDRLKDRLDLKLWNKGYCPVCGSLPHMSELRGEGQRYFMCSFCSFKWQGDRIMCPFCENRDHQTLQYFYAEGNETHRVDVCNQCKQYIKTIDTRKIDYEPDLNLEDITSIHLDILTSQKGFKRPVPTPWGP
jgi:FdhE protein